MDSRKLIAREWIYLLVFLFIVGGCSSPELEKIDIDIGIVDNALIAKQDSSLVLKERLVLDDSLLNLFGESITRQDSLRSLHDELMGQSFGQYTDLSANRAQMDESIELHFDEVKEALAAVTSSWGNIESLVNENKLAFENMGVSFDGDSLHYDLQEYRASKNRAARLKIEIDSLNTSLKDLYVKRAAFK